MAGGNLTVTTSGAIDNQRPAAGRRYADPDGFEPGQQQHADRQQRARQGRKQGKVVIPWPRA
ncbi:hypothetical protein WJ970_02645 [Achromobacter xylosoxidans]